VTAISCSMQGSEGVLDRQAAILIIHTLQGRMLMLEPLKHSASPFGASSTDLCVLAKFHTSQSSVVVGWWGSGEVDDTSSTGDGDVQSPECPEQEVSGHDYMLLSRHRPLQTVVFRPKYLCPVRPTCAGT
jgi:hypothetical protein